MHRNALFLTENLSPGSHTMDTLEGIKKNLKNVFTLNYCEYYNDYGKAGLEYRIVEIIKSKKIDLLVINLGTSFILDGDYIAKMSNDNPIKIVIIFPDPEHNFEDHDRYYAQCADLCWLFAAGAESFFNLYGYETFSGQGFSIERYPLLNNNKIYDVSFVGGINRADRKNYIDFLKFNGIDVKLAGYGTKAGLVDVNEKNRIISSSYIHLNFTKVENGSLNIFSRVRQQKGRLIEASLLGTLVLSEYCPGIRDIFTEEELPIFKTPEELLNKINYYLHNKNIVNNMSKLAHKKSLEYESSKVFARLLSKLVKVNFYPKKFLEDDLFTNKFISHRYYFLSKFIFRLRFDLAFVEFKYILSRKKISFNNIFFDIPKGLKHALF